MFWSFWLQMQNSMGLQFSFVFFICHFSYILNWSSEKKEFLGLLIIMNIPSGFPLCYLAQMFLQLRYSKIILS